MRNLRRFEAACGLAAALFGFLGIAYALFGPTYSFQSSSGQTGTASMVQLGPSPSVLISVGVLVFVPIGVAISAVVHSRTGGRGWQIMLWVATTIIVIITFLTGFSIGLLLLPGTLFAIGASALSLGVRRAALG
jgi:hypothetical protein